MEHSFKAGAGRAELAFPVDYFPADGYSGIHDPMYCRALLLEEGPVRGGLVVLELPSVRPWERTDELRAYAAELLNAPYENVWLVVTHDLSAPHVPREEAHQALHMDVLRQAVSEACGQAAASLREAVVRYAGGSSDVNANRDVESVDGWWVGIHGKGPSDKTLSLLRFDGLDGGPIAVLYSYAIKSSVLEGADMPDGKRYASGDVTGRAGVKAEKALGCPVLFVMGAAGDQVPKRKANYLALDENGHFYTVDLGEQGYEVLEALSDTLSGDILAAASASAPGGERPALRFAAASVECAAKKPYPKSLPAPPVRRYAYEPDGTQTLDIWAIRVGEAAILGVKPEITTPIFDAIKKNSPFPHTLIATLANGGQGYIATDWDFPRFTYPALHTPFQPGTDRKLIEQVQALLDRIR